MYRDNSSLSNNMYSDSMVYSSRVPVFRSSYYERLFSKHEVYEVSFVSAAAPVLPASNTNNMNNKRMLVYSPNMKNAQNILMNRVRKMIMVAIENNNNALVIGIYGNQLFDNSQTSVLTSVFNQVLKSDGLGKYFIKVVFALFVKDSHSNEMFKQFSASFS